MRTYQDNFNADFTCKQCGGFVSAEIMLSGVVNRNHCPYCLHSRHVDLFEPGDRLCACKSLMVPIGLTQKNVRDKYAHHHQGELMLIHRCLNCGALSINRIAADDDPEKLQAVFFNSQMLDSKLHSRYERELIQPLKIKDQDLVKERLFGICG